MTLTRRNGHSTRFFKLNLKGTLPSEFEWNFKDIFFKELYDKHLRGTLTLKCKQKLDIEIQMTLSNLNVKDMIKSKLKGYTQSEV